MEEQGVSVYLGAFLPCTHTGPHFAPALPGTEPHSVVP